MIGPYSIKLSNEELLILRISINNPNLTNQEVEDIAKGIINVYDLVFIKN